MIITVEVDKYIVTNAYFYIDDATKCGFLIDPGAEADKLLRIIDEKNIHIEKILLTHGHFDHIGAASEIQKKFGIPIIMRHAGKDYATRTDRNLSTLTGDEIILDDVTYVDDFSDISLAAAPNFGVKILPLAGHTTDGAVYYAAHDKTAFVGDSIFKGSYGRTDLFGGDENTLLTNIVKTIFTLPDDTALYTGHSEPTTVGEEKRLPFWQATMNSLGSMR